MSCPELVKLVKAYSYGEIPLEVYREKRRQIINEFTDDVETKTPTKKDDPLDSFIASAPEKPASPHKSLYLAIAGATLAVVLAIGIAVFFFPSTDSTTEIADGSKQASAELTDKSQAQRLIETFLLTDQWNEESINQFILDWQILTAADRQRAQNTQWFSNFKSIIQNRLDSQKTEQQADPLSEDLMTTLLATVDPGYFISGSFFDQSSTAQTEGDITPSTEPDKLPLVATQSKEPVTTPEKKISQAPRKEQITKEQKSSQAEKSPDSSQADIVLNKFVKSFENGNLNSLMQLFSPNATTNHHTSSTEISASYSELFQTTEKRDLEFTDFSWKPSGGKLEGNGKYLAHLNPKGTNIEQIFSADVTILVDAASKPAQITGLYLTNQQFSTSLRPSVKAAIPEAQKLPPPDKEELRILLQNFVASYNRGDVESLMSLFSQEARTNDRSNINEIREDYKQLFQTTKSREIVLRDVTWKFTANKAVASGLFEAKIQPATNRQINVYRGKIRIAVTKYEGGILITQLLHNTQ
ncbi:hypothetical protein [Kaarinaea lacus]